jgi:radical SAM superfamily enzyme YgiQ (UPF0313 family)
LGEKGRTNVFRHVLCVYPYRVEIERDYGFYPPLGLEIVAAALSPYSRRIDVIDMRHESGHTTDFLQPDTDLVCFSVNWGRERDFVREEILSIPRDIRTIVGGRHATQDPEGWLADCPNVDILVRGDGEEAIEEIARGEPLAGVAGISYRLDGRLVHNPVRHCAPVSDDLWPNRRLRRYSYTLDLGSLRGRSFDTVSSSRGCPFNCTFCSFTRNPWGEKRAWTARSPESVVREIEEIDADVVAFLDDNFTHDPDRVAAICDLLRARGIRKRYIANARLEIARRPDVLRKMERAGFSMLLLGIESAQDKSLRSMRKGFTVKQVREYFSVLRRSSMVLLGYFIVGNIGETEQEMLQIGPFARELGIDVLNLCMLRSEPYSGLEELVAQTPGYHIAPDGLRFVYSDQCSVRHLQRIERTMRHRFYSPGQILRILRKGLRNGIITPAIFVPLPLFLMRKALERRRRKKARLKRRRSAAWAR